MIEPIRMEMLRKIRMIADYQFGTGAGDALFPDDVEFVLSSKGDVRQIFHRGSRIATLRAQDGLFTLGIEGARRLHSRFRYPKLRVVVSDEAAEFVKKGRSAFAKHVIDVDPEIRAGEEVIVVDGNDRLLATGKAVLCADEMKYMRRGVAVEIRDHE